MTKAKLTSDLITRARWDDAAVSTDATTAPRKRRALVLTDEAAQHPFRANLPPHVRADLHDIPAEALWRLTAEDVRGVASTYVATTAAVLAFIL